MRAQRQDGSGFTLIEMLVVMAVILTLLGIMLPSLYGVRDRAYMAVCASNLHQIGIAFTAYLGDNGGFYPRTYSMSTERDYWLAGSSPNMYTDRRSAIGAYVPSPGVFKCPVDPAPFWGDLSYVMNLEFTGWDGANSAHGINIKMVLNGEMSKYILLLEQRTMDDETCRSNITVVDGEDFADGAPAPKGFSQRHVNSTGGVLFADGHVAFVRAGSAATSTTTCTCNGGTGCCTTTTTAGASALNYSCDPSAAGTAAGKCMLTPQGKWAN